MSSMDADIKTEWVKRLRSGDYEQGREALCRNGAYCCLGVLAEMAAEDGAVKREVVTRPTHEGAKSTVLFESLPATLPNQVMEWAGFVSIGSCGDFYDDNGDWHSLANFNDGGKTFDEIADIIEKRL